MTTLKRFLTFVTFTALAMQVWGEDYSEITTITSGTVVNNSSYNAYTYNASEAGADTIDWVITFGGNNKSVGTNSSNRNNCKLSSYTKYAVSPVTSTQVASAFVSTTAISDVSKISYTFNGGSNQTSTNVYLIYSSNGTSFSQISLTSGEQGASISSGTEYEFAKCTGYFGLLFVATNASGNWRIDDVSISLYKTAAPACDDKVTISKSSAALPTGCSFTLDKEGETATCSAVTLTITPTCATHYSVTSVTESNSRIVTNNGDGTYSVTYTANSTGSSTISVTFAEDTKHTVTFQNNGVTLASGGTREVYDGDAIGTLPVLTDGDACDLTSTTFMGWTEDVISDKTDIEPTMISASTTITTNKTYNAVWAKVTSSGSGDYEKVTSNLADYCGTYLIVYEGDSRCLDGNLTTLDAASNYRSVSISSSTITSSATVDNYSFTITAGSTSGKYYIKSHSGYFIGSTAASSSDGNELLSSTSTPYDNNISVSSGNATISGPDHILKYFKQSGQAERFRYYKSTTSSNVNLPQLYKKAGSTTTEDYITDCGAGCSTPTLEFAAATINKFLGDAAFKNNLTITGNDLDAELTYTSSNPTKATVDGNGYVTILDAMSNEPITITASLAKKTVGMDCQKAVKATYTLNIYNRVTWSVNGVSYTEGDPTQQAVEGGTISAYPTPDPDGSTACGGKTFVGWTTAPYPESDDAPGTLYTSLSDMSGVHITDNTTFYAVFAEVGGESENQYKKVTSPASEMTTGKRVLIVHNSSSKAMSNTESGNGYAGVTVTPDGEGKITTTNSAIIWTVIKGTTGFFFHQGDNYINAAPDKNNNHYLWIDEYPDEWTLTGSGPYVLHSTQDPGYQFQYYSNVFQTYTGTSGSAYNMDFYVPDLGYSAYSTTCGPNIKAGEVERLTSTKDQTVQSQAITVKGSSLDGSTLSATITGTNASLFSCSLAATTITAGSIETTYTIRYTPNAFGDAQHTATLTFTDGTTTSDPISLYGRSLPENFAIVAYDGANYYALDGTMSGEASTVKPFPVTVSAGSVDLCPTQAIYYLTELETPDQNVHLVGPSGRLYGASSGTGLNTKSLSSTSGTGWLLTTKDFNTYHITNATTTDRGVMYNDANNVFGHYKTTNYGTSHYFGDIRLLPITNECTCLPAPIPAVVARATTATINWDAVPGAVSYAVTCSGGAAPVIDGCKATITGLANNTEYTFTVKAVASGYDCSLSYNGSFTTTNCDDVPYNIVTTPGIKSVTVKWSMDAATAKICIYSDEACTTPVGSAHSGLTSPATIIGLEENTQYYLKIFAGAGENCESSVVPFLTQTTAVEIAEWATDHINIVLNADAATATVEIDNKREHGSATSMVATDIFFSKYFEASGFTKLVGLYNGTDHDIDISDLIIKAGTTSWTTTKGANNYVAVGDISKLNDEYGDGAGHIMLPKNTEIILYSLKDDNKAGFSGEGCLDQFYDWDDLADNLVPNWYRIGKTNTSGSAVDTDGHNTLNFSGPHSISLWRSTTMIDIIGAGNSSSPTDASTIEVKTLHTLGNGRTINCPNDKEGFFCEEGWSPIPQEGDPDSEGYPEGYSTFLTTNRCLLIRANHVTNGDSAVLNNTATFKTLGGENREYDGVDGKKHKAEWVGIPIGNDGTSAERDCLSGAQFGYVGQYDYSDYYVKYDSIGELKELDGKRNEDGTYTIPIPQLDTMSCTMLKVKVYEGGVEKASREYKVPIMIDAEATTKDDKYFHSYARETNSADVCRECDVVILGSGTLTKASSDEAKDIPEIHNLTIYPGGTLVVPEGPKYEYTVNSIQFRVQGEQTPVAKLKGDLITNDGQVLVSRRINNSRYYFFSLPYDCNIDEVRWSNGTPATNGVDYRIAEYDSETRAAEGSTKGAPGHYKQVTGNTLKAGVGYVIATNDRYLKELVFPMDIGSTNLTTAENTKTTNKVALHQYTGSSSINNHNWNLIAHPYVSAFNAYEDGKIKAGYLHCVSPKTETEDAVWEYVDESHVYLTMPSFNTDKTTYTQTLSSTVGTINPFLAVFVQAAAEGDMTFDPGDRILSAPARHLAAQAEKTDESIFVGVTLSGNGQSDQTNLRIRPDFTDEYQLGYDLLKFTTYYTARPQIFMKTPSHQLAFQAVNDSVAKSCFLPMGVYCEYAGTYTFALDEHYPIDEVEAVYLYDKTTGTTTNLLYDTYTITTSGRINTTSRFSLNVWLNRKAPQITTGIDGVEAPDGITRKILINDHVYIQRDGAIYDVTGKEVFNF